MRALVRSIVCGLLALWCPASLVVAQETVPGFEDTGSAVRVIPSPVLIVDLDRLYVESAFGQRVEAEYAAAGEVLEADSQATQAELEAEERMLAEQRPDMEMDAFREAAEAFDLKVEGIRAEYDARETAVQAARSEAIDDFRSRVRPLLGQIMIDNRSLVMLEAEDAYLFVTAIDITDQAIRLSDQVLGNGTETE